jgi:GTP cyclohydrolase III
MTPEQLAARIESNLQRLAADLEAAQEDATAAIYGYERSIVHVVTRDLQHSLTPIGPYRVGNVIESRIVPVNVRYAEAEHRRGGSHAYATRAMAETGAAQEQWRRAVERAGARVVEG